MDFLNREHGSELLYGIHKAMLDIEAVVTLSDADFVEVWFTDIEGVFSFLDDEIKAFDVEDWNLIPARGVSLQAFFPTRFTDESEAIGGAWAEVAGFRFALGLGFFFPMSFFPCAGFCHMDVFMPCDTGEHLMEVGFLDGVSEAFEYLLGFVDECFVGWFHITSFLYG